MARAAQNSPKTWAQLEERGADWGPATLAFIYRVLGRGACIAAMAPVVVHFFVFGATQRRASLDFLRRVWAANGRTDKPNLIHALRHYFSFGVSLVDKFGAWIGQIQRDEIEAIDGSAFNDLRNDPRGAVIVTAHFGTIEIIRAMGARKATRRVNVVMHTKNARQYNALIERFAPESRVSLIEASEFDMGAAMALSAAIERGEWVVLMGDRIPAHGGGRVIEAEFLGAPAAFPQGPFVLAAALRAPVYMLFCYRRGGRYRVDAGLLSDATAGGGRRNRMAGLEAIVKRFAKALETQVKEAPYQWFNFYEFWNVEGGAGRKAGAAEGDKAGSRAQQN